MKSIPNTLTTHSAHQLKKNVLNVSKMIKDSVFEVHNRPVMESVLDVLSILGKNKEVTIRAKGDLISNAVSISLIITEKMLKKNSKIQQVTVDSELKPDLGGSVSTIEIILKKHP